MSNAVLNPNSLMIKNRDKAFRLQVVSLLALQCLKLYKKPQVLVLSKTLYLSSSIF